MSRPEAYPEGTSRVDAVETHMSWVFITDRYAYKLRKPARHPLLDFSTILARRRNSLAALRLNRRLAPEVYLSVVPLTQDEYGNLHLAGVGAPVDWLVKMRRLAPELSLEHAIRSRTWNAEDIVRCVRKLAAFYRAAPPVIVSPARYRQRFAREVRANRRVLCDPSYGLDRTLVARTATAQIDLLSRQPELLERRVSEHRLIEAHGDLRPEHVYLTPDPVFIDCLEFRRSLRTAEPVHELAYLAVECEYLGEGRIGDVLFASYEAETGDVAPPRLVDFYKSYRATLRAKLAVWHTHDHDPREREKWIGRAERYLRFADIYANRLTAASSE